MTMTPAAAIQVLQVLGLSDLLPDISTAATHRAEAAVNRGDDTEADRWFALSDAADEAMLAADARATTTRPVPWLAGRGAQP